MGSKNKYTRYIDGCTKRRHTHTIIIVEQSAVMLYYTDVYEIVSILNKENKCWTVTMRFLDSLRHEFLLEEDKYILELAIEVELTIFLIIAYQI